jgi:hypothetical protein
MKTFIRLLIALSLFLPLEAFGQATSENDERLRRSLLKFPQADTDGDGVLTQAEGAAFLQKRRANRKPLKMIAPTPTYEDVKYGPYDRNVYDIWLPESGEPTALIIQVHGGGFRGGDKSRIRAQKTVQNTLDAGLAFASINYRFAYTSPEDVDNPQKTSIQNVLRDSARALQHMRSKAGGYNIDKTRIGMYGGSAGAGTSLFIGFRDDLADPENEDPVLRESTRLIVVGMLNGQFTYDLEAWDPAFAKRYGNDTKTRAELRASESDASGFYGLTTEEYDGAKGQAARADVDMINHISKDDPAVFILCTNPALQPLTTGELQHDPLHAELIEARAKEHGLDVLTLLPKVRPEDKEKGNSTSKLLLDFFLEHLDDSVGIDL